jgi:hypothetical protein
MNIDQLLSQTFAAHEHLSPDPEATLDGVHRAIHTRRRAVTRSVTVAAAAATVAAVAVGASVVGAHRSAVPGRSVAPAGAGTDRAGGNPAPAVSAGRYGFLTLGPGWLPVGATQTLASHSARDGQDGQRLVYEARDAIPGHGSARIELTLDVGEQPDHGSTLFGSPSHTTVGGRPGTEWRGGSGYFVTFPAPSGHRATVSVTVDRDAPAADALRTLGRAIATSLRSDQRTPLRTTFTLGSLPPGYEIRGVSLERGTTYQLGRPGSGNGDLPYITVGEVQGGREQILSHPGGKTVAPSTPGRPVNGHPTWVVTSHDYPGVFVEHYRPGWSLTVFGTAIDVSTLYRIADGVRAS